MPSEINQCLEKSRRERGATTVEYAVIIVAMILVLLATVLWLVNPADPTNSLLTNTYTTVGNHIGNFDIKNIPTE